MDTVTEAYLAFAIMTLVGIGFPVGAFIASYFLRPIEDPNDRTKVRSILLPGYDRDHTLYPRAATTYECGAEPLGEAHINFHFQYYWYAIIFLVFDIAFMFLAFGGILVIQDGAISIYSSLGTLTVFIVLMGAGVWHVFRKRGRIYI